MGIHLFSCQDDESIINPYEEITTPLPAINISAFSKQDKFE